MIRFYKRGKENVIYCKCMRKAEVYNKEQGKIKVKKNKLRFYLIY